MNLSHEFKIIKGMSISNECECDVNKKKSRSNLRIPTRTISSRRTELVVESFSVIDFRSWQLS